MNYPRWVPTSRRRHRTKHPLSLAIEAAALLSSASRAMAPLHATIGHRQSLPAVHSPLRGQDLIHEYPFVIVIIIVHLWSNDWDKNVPYPFASLNLGCRSCFGWLVFNEVRRPVDRIAVNLVHQSVNLFHGFCFWKIIPKILKNPRFRFFLAKEPLEFSLFILQSFLSSKIILLITENPKSCTFYI
jgi:hypothetical protein